MSTHNSHLAECLAQIDQIFIEFRQLHQRDTPTPTMSSPPPPSAPHVHKHIPNAPSAPRAMRSIQQAVPGAPSGPRSSYSSPPLSITSSSSSTPIHKPSTPSPRKKSGVPPGLLRAAASPIGVKKRETAGKVGKVRGESATIWAKGLSLPIRLRDAGILDEGEEASGINDVEIKHEGAKVRIKPEGEGRGVINGEADRGGEGGGIFLDRFKRWRGTVYGEDGIPKEDA